MYKIFYSRIEKMKKHGLYFSYEIRKEKKQMKKNMKKAIGNMVIHVGKHAVGKSLGYGMYDPKIPDILKINNKERK